MKRETIRNATEAHGWLGLIISVPLFIIFWAGSVTLFLPEVVRWASLPQLPISAEQQTLSINQVIDANIPKVDYDDSRQIFVRKPNDYSPHFKLQLPVFKNDEERIAASQYKQQVKAIIAQGIDVDVKRQALEKPKNANEYQVLLIDPATGEVLAENNPFELANFINHMHYTLHLPQGRYLVGIVTFFFLVIIITGIVIQLKKMVENFFQYRRDKTLRYKMTDLHNVVGVISLPYGLMFAITGLMFNLGIVFQIPTAMLLYKGNMNAMIEVAGFHNLQKEPVYSDMAMPDLNQLIERVEQEHAARVDGLNIQNYGDENAVVRFSGFKQDSFAELLQRFYLVKENEFPTKYNPTETSAFGVGVVSLFSVHLANFAALELRFLYFLLGIGVCMMIVAGNVLWIAKRQKSGDYKRTVMFMRGLTLGASMGVIIATAFGFLLERVLPVTIDNRVAMVTYSFGIVLLISVVAAFFNRNLKAFVAACCYLSAAILAVLVMYDLLLMNAVIAQLWQAGFSQPALVTFALILVAACMLFIGKSLNKQDAKPLAASTTVVS